MLIHTVKCGEDLYSIAREYSTYPQKLLNDNFPIDERLREGDELLVIIPTKTLTVRGGDTVSSIALRNGIKENTLLRQNSELMRCGLKPGQTVTLKQNSPPLGAACAIGNYSLRDPISKLKNSLQYLTYLAIDCATVTNQGIKTVSGIDDAVKRCLAAGKLPLLKVRDESGAKAFKTDKDRSAVIDTLIALAKKQGFKGILIDSADISENDSENFLEFLLKARKKLLGCDLILFTELHDSTPLDASEISDGAILNTDIDTIANVKKKLMSIAKRTESSKIFVSIYTDIQINGKQLPITEAISIASHRFSPITTNQTTLLSTLAYSKIENGKHKILPIEFPSLKYTKAKFEELAELGFMGISVNLSSIDTARLCMFNASFRRADYSLA